ncbi:antibiotic biosynthesis monooxygenase [Streptomyces gardneri]|uniref:Antibiotic biosynthesis monooxygenase n=1 Tax=Streptomyces gardneri TaxID=66892 RepID=A0A4Y3RN76_9ACTN|nr:antibiotic biosynthesis monooxygenase [Streptomyces gardneri]GEB59226.1 antibiotic biosynthesis monooxygenase [Streptomyces gardneri]GHG91095.1 antibiotic biosynthesis monooxygenase [Streptomyces gardneri]
MNAVAHPDARPDLHRSGVGAVLVSTWRVGTPERQRAAVDAIRKAWESREWPDLGLLSYSVHVGTDGDTLLHYSQWTAEEAYEDFVRTYRDDRNAEIDAAVPGIERVELRRYAPIHRSAVRAGRGTGELPGIVVVVEADFGGPEAGSREDWVDTVFTAMDEDAATRPGSGGAAAHFHLSTDGGRVLNYAEWESEQAHVEWLADDARLDEAWTRVHHYPGLVGGRVKRYTPALSLSAGV